MLCVCVVRCDIKISLESHAAFESMFHDRLCCMKSAYVVLVWEQHQRKRHILPLG